MQMIQINSHPTNELKRPELESGSRSTPDRRFEEGMPQPSPQPNQHLTCRHGDSVVLTEKNRKGEGILFSTEEMIKFWSGRPKR
ncbi:hypothetical protein MANES_17G075650v8 [Manihot esculenta]|uniref:Uncharacterized protein n=1 Tax=Manihot esculenta TaxID=3983 RepID=A0ACB7G4P7_MANES|nr:hypothetical protein MANES_17G075650v8 [Manihot esculenta]